MSMGEIIRNSYIDGRQHPRHAETHRGVQLSESEQHMGITTRHNLRIVRNNDDCRAFVAQTLQ